MADRKISDYTATTTPTSGDLHLLQRASAYLKLDHDDLLTGLSTDGLAEGVSNEYFTNERAQDAVGSAISNTGNDVALTYNDGANTLGANISNLDNFTTDDLVSGSASSQLQFQNLGISHAEILALNTTPYVRQVSVPSGRIMIPIRIFAQSRSKPSGYTNSGFTVRASTSGDILCNFSSDVLNTTSAIHAIGFPHTSSSALDPNSELIVEANTSDPTGGDASNVLSIIVVFIAIDMI